MKVVALIVGLVFLGLGIASFVPSLVVDGMLFGGIPVNTTFSVVYIVVGAIGVMFGLSHRRSIERFGERATPLVMVNERYFWAMAQF